MHRIIYPLRHLAPHYSQHQFIAAQQTNIGEHFDWAITHSLNKVEACQVFGNWKRDNTAWCFSLDDDILQIPPWNPVCVDADHRGLWHLYRDAADAILCSTEPIAESLKRPNKTVVAKNLIEVGGYGVSSVSPVEESIRILWAGSKTHAGDIAVIDDALCELLAKYGTKKLDVIFVGDAPRKLLRNYVDGGVTFQQGVFSSQYAAFMGTVRPHIVLAPLATVPFNLSKSNIRVLEGWSLNAAVVATPFGEYNVIEDGVDGLFARTTEEWISQIEKLILDEKLRQNIAANGYVRVKRQWDWRNPACLGEWHNYIVKLESLR
jgi:glycosyltransferase involved in cell wall biosynthesis